jgi:hypothetical protein
MRFRTTIILFIILAIVGAVLVILKLTKRQEESRIPREELLVNQDIIRNAKKIEIIRKDEQKIVIQNHYQQDLKWRTILLQLHKI